MAEDPSHVRITNLMMYEKLMDINENQIAMMSELKTLGSLPDRVRSVESRLDKQDWIEKVAYSALGASVVALVAAVIRLISGV
jgi:hypothetical protein